MGKARGQWEWGFVLLLVASYGVAKVAIQASAAQGFVVFATCVHNAVAHDLWLRGWPRAVRAAGVLWDVVTVFGECCRCFGE